MNIWTFMGCLSIVPGGKGTLAQVVGSVVKMDTISGVVVAARSTFTEQRESIAESFVGREGIH